jgi:pimeloyl-ACP methyl ester carboxylesterase
MICTLIHGIRTEPNSPVKGLIQYLEAAGHTVKYPEYGYELAIETRIFNPAIVGILLPFIEPGSILIGHSNGCAISQALIMAGAPVKGAVFINGALETNFPIPASLEFVDCFFNSGDDITEIAKLGEELNIYPGDWGALGHFGYQGNDPRVTNFDCGNTPNMPVIHGHSDIFTPEKLAIWGPFLAGRLTR